MSGPDVRRRVALFVFSAQANTLGRAYALWLAADELGWDVAIVAPAIDAPWPPVAGEERFVACLTADAEEAAERADVLVALKPWPGALDVAWRLGARFGKPVAVDVDDPDWESEYGASPAGRLRVLVRRALRGDIPVQAYRLRRRTARLERVLVSNPALHRWYPGGVVVPHARRPRPAGRPPTSGSTIEVAFVGTVVPHKGVDVLRRAAAAAGGVELVVTGAPPSDRLEHERWIGETSLEEGLGVIDGCDVAAIPSMPWTYAEGQLPAKLIDAMMAGRAIVASDVGPVRWALDGAGLLVRPGDAAALTEALVQLRSPELRARLGEAARARALDRFTPAAVARDLATALEGG
jgi:glycosyltransferase involved in cell wall biosynthesis